MIKPQSRFIQSANFANGLNDWNTYTQDYELDVLGLYDGATSLINRAHTRTDALNLTNIYDNVTSANTMTLSYSAANRLQNADGAWGSKTFYYDGVGNRIEERATPPGGSQTISTLDYPATSNRVTDITQGATTVRSIGYDAAGNITSDNRLGSTYAYTYNDAGRLKTVSYEGNLKGTYTYNGQHQLIGRVITNSGSENGTTHYVHDRGGNVIAELDASGATAREYIWLPETEIAPTAASRAQIDRPIAVVDGVDTATPVTYYVHTDHLNRPIKMSDASKAIQWSAEYQPWDAVQSLSGPLTLDLRFPGQWFQLEAGLHYNWHRHYDPSLGRYTQPDPLGFVDGPSVYGYARGNPYRYVDPDGRNPAGVCALVPAACGTAIEKTVEVCLAIGTYIITQMSKKKEGFCSCSHRDRNKVGNEDWACLRLRNQGICTGPYKDTGTDTASCQANARENAPTACRACLGHCKFFSN